jgi:hypothetical protein
MTASVFRFRFPLPHIDPENGAVAQPRQQKRSFRPLEDGFVTITRVNAQSTYVKLTICLICTL